jgi:hypothetical protein
MREILFIPIVWALAEGAAEYVSVHITLLAMSAVIIALACKKDKNSTRGDY